MESTDVDLVVAALARVADEVTTRPRDDAEQVLVRLVEAAARTVPGADGVGVTQVDDEGGVSSRAPSAGWVADLDRLQAELDEGPCVLAAEGRREMHVVEVSDLAGAGTERWPRWAPAAVERGVGSMLSFSMAPHDRPLGALNLYAYGPAAFGPADRLLGEVFAMQTAIALYGARRAEHLIRAVESRDVIGQAKGILIERFAVTDAQAFDMLVQSSQQTNMKLVDVARWVSDEAQQPGRDRTEAPGTAVS